MVVGDYRLICTHYQPPGLCLGNIDVTVAFSPTLPNPLPPLILPSVSSTRKIIKLITPGAITGVVTGGVIKSSFQRQPKLFSCRQLLVPDYNTAVGTIPYS